MSTQPQQPPSLWETVERAAERYPDRVMLRDEYGFVATFSEFRDWSARMARELAAQGIAADDVVVWQLPSQSRTLMAMAALSLLGAKQVPLITQYRSRELSFVTEEINPQHLIVPDRWRAIDFVGLAKESSPAETRVIALPQLDQLEESVPAPLPGAGVRRDEWVYYTSGTTGNPRGAMHQTANFLAGGECWAERVGVRPTDCLTINFPIAHVGGICYLLVSLMAGCSIAISDTFGPHLFDFYEESGVTLAAAGTAFHQVFLHEQRQHPERRLLPSVRAFVGGGAPKPSSLHYAMKETFDGIGVVSGYGMTEGMMLSMNRPGDQDDKLARSEGMPGLRVDLRIVGADGVVCASGAVGEIRVKSPTLFSGYVNPELTAQAFDEQGYLHTGDLGYLDEDGYLIISGRMKDVIIRKGETLDAKEIEDALATHPAVVEVAVVGIPDEDRGELVCAVVVMSEAYADTPEQEVIDTFIRHVKERGLMKQKIPERFEFQLVLPRNPTGKVKKDQLRTTLADGESGAGA
jgi:cyclohexanecarboxylate-CoA ligase